MKTKLILVCSALAVLTLVGAAPGGAPTCVHGPFLGITATSESGEIIGAPDPRDWGCVDDPGAARPVQGSRAARASSPPPPAPPAACLDPAFPNPTAGAARLRFSLPAAAHVSLLVYGPARPPHAPPGGILVRTLVQADLAAGLHEVVWDGTDAAGARVPSGIYRVVMTMEDGTVCGDIEIR